MQLNDYEKERQRKIKENQELLLKLGLNQVVIEPKVTKKPKSPKKNKDSDEFKPEATRKSSRVSKAISYNSDSDNDYGNRYYKKNGKNNGSGGIRWGGGKGYRNPNPGLRVVGGRVYDPVKGSTCHQCRQKTTDAKIHCTNFINGRKCTVCFDHNCLLVRYNENAQEEIEKGNWKCPKCRDICNCSFCRRKRGQRPTGQLSIYLRYNSDDEDLAKGTDPEKIRKLIEMRTSGRPRRKRKSGRISYEGLELEDGMMVEEEVKEYRFRRRSKDKITNYSQMFSDDSEAESVDIDSEPESEIEKENDNTQPLLKPKAKRKPTSSSTSTSTPRSSHRKSRGDRVGAKRPITKNLYKNKKFNPSPWSHNVQIQIPIVPITVTSSKPPRLPF